MRRLVVAIALATVLAVPQPVIAAEVVEAWSVDDRPFGVVVGPDGRVYVTNEGSATLSVVDPVADTVRRVFVGSAPGSLALDAVAGRLYVSNSGSSTVSVVDVTTLGVVATVFDAGGLGVAVDPVAQRMYVAGGATFSMYDVSTSPIRRIRLVSVTAEESWFGVVHDAANHRLYVTNIATLSPSLRVLDDRDLGVIDNVPLPKPVRFAFAVHPTTGAVLLASEDPLGPPFANSELYVVDPISLTVVHTTPLGGFSAGLALAPDLHRVFVTDQSGRRLHELDDQTFALLATSPLPWEPSHAAMHADGRLYVAGYGGDVLGAVSFQDENVAPVIDSFTLSPADPRTNDLLETALTSHDPDGDEVEVSYQWSKNHEPIPGAIGSTLSLATPGAGDRDDVISVTVTVSDDSASVSATASVTVLDTAPTVTLELSPSDPASDSVLTATATGSDVDGDSLTYAFEFKVGDVVVKSVSSPNSSAVLDLSIPGNGDGGDVVVVEVVASDGTLASEMASASVTVANTAPTADVVLSDATPWKTDVLVASATGDDADGDPLVFSYKWFVYGALVQETTTSSSTDSLELKPYVDNGDVVTVSVTASDGVATSSSATASAVVTPPGLQPE